MISKSFVCHFIFTFLFRPLPWCYECVSSIYNILMTTEKQNCGDHISNEDWISRSVDRLVRMGKYLSLMALVVKQTGIRHKTSAMMKQILLAVTILILMLLFFRKLLHLLHCCTLRVTPRVVAKKQTMMEMTIRPLGSASKES